MRSLLFQNWSKVFISFGRIYFHMSTNCESNTTVLLIWDLKRFPSKLAIAAITCTIITLTLRRKINISPSNFFETNLDWKTFEVFSTIVQCSEDSGCSACTAEKLNLKMKDPLYVRIVETIFAHRRSSLPCNFSATMIFVLPLLQCRKFWLL